MCFDDDSRPPIAPMAGGALDSSQLVLTAEDGNRLAAFEARALDATGAAILILPDVRGLHPYYEELALRFAEHGFDAIAIDYFGRTAGAEPRAESFEYMPHVRQLTWPGTQADIRAGIDQIRSRGTTPDRLFSIGFCIGGRTSFLAAAPGGGFEGVIGFYGRVVGAHPSGSAAPAELAGEVRGRVLGLVARDDEGDPPADRRALAPTPY